MYYKSFTVSPFQENTYVLWDDTLECIIVDPGCYTSQELAEVSSFISDNRLRPHAVLNTHCHIDHIFGVSHFMDAFGIPFICHEYEKLNLDKFEFQADLFGLRVNGVAPEPTQYLTDERTFTFGNTSLEIFFVPGHSPGHLAFYHKESGILVSGDVLFRESIGRTDLPGCDHEQLLQSIRDVLYVLPNETTVLAGHMGETTIGYEKRNNPFIRG